MNYVKVCLRFLQQIRMQVLLAFYAILLLLFVVAKWVFMGYNGGGQALCLADYLAVVWHGLPLDFATAGYLSAVPLLLLIAALWVQPARLRWGYRVYALVVAVLLATIFLADTCLYSFWGFKLDGTVWTYLDSPKGVMASVTPGYIAVVVVVHLLLSSCIFLCLRRVWVQTQFQPTSKGRCLALLAYLLVGGLMFLGIRGGVGKSTANVGMVYYSDKAFLNHAAVNPAFSLIASSLKTKDFARQHNYFDEPQRAQLFGALAYSTESVAPDTLLRISRPNVLIILMEGCGASFVEAFGGAPGVMPRLSALAHEGIAFTRCYANSFRTDRGTICALSGYPSFPDVSVMKQAAKAGRLPSIARSLAQEGYHTEFVYGGDINFTNMNGYLRATGYAKTYGDKDFPAEERKTHDWGVTDHLMFAHLSDILAAYPTDKPWHTTFLTLASHEPWIVPCQAFPNDLQANGMAYLDRCIGEFIEAFRQSPLWENTLIVFLPDHGILYPATMDAADMQRNHIPMVWTGGAIVGARSIDKICNQTDLAATLLGQMGVAHDEFTFSRDVLSATYTYPCALHTASGTLCFVDSTGVSVIDLVSTPERLLIDSPTTSRHRVEAAHAFLQTAYDDLGGL